VALKPIRAGASGLAAHTGARPLSVLVVEDNPVNQTLVAHMLECMGHAATLAEHGAQALELAANNDYDAILMDMQMPVMDGATATRLIRMLPDGRASVPVIALTADSYSDHSELVETRQLNAFLTKPVSLERLARTLNEVVGSEVAGGPAPAPAAEAPPPPEATEGDGLPVLDSAYLDDMRQWVGDETVLALLATAPDSLRGEFAALRAAWAAGDLHQVHETGHRMKGAAGSVGARRLAALAHAMQNLSPAEFTGTLRLDGLAAALDTAMAALAAWRPPT
jgi:CheY-like chemotaxis protein